jgi:hypothetical protein
MVFVLSVNVFQTDVNGACTKQMLNTPLMITAGYVTLLSHHLLASLSVTRVHSDDTGLGQLTFTDWNPGLHS